MCTIGGLGRHIGRQSTDSRPIVDRYIGRLSADASADMCTFIGPLSADLSVDYRPIVGRLSTDSRPIDVSADMSTEATYSTHDPEFLGMFKNYWEF